MALKVVVSRAGSTEPVAEHQFGKEARARGVTVGADPDNEIVLAGITDKAGRVERQKTGYYYVDLGSGVGYVADGKKGEPGSATQVTVGTRVTLGEWTLTFERGETPRRVESPAAVSTANTDVNASAYKLISDVSRYFLGEGHFETTDEVERFAALMKLTLEIAMEWMSRALRGREEFKDQFSAPLTEIYARSLNPVKAKGQDISQISNFLLDWREDRDLDEIRDALQHAFQDMARHQMGLLAGVQQFVSDLQARLDPDNIKKEAGGGLFSAKKAWEHYGELYGETFTESSKLFNELIYPSIRKGYIFSHEEIQSDNKPGTG
ncbi:MAG: hypothetical protein K8I27_00640 [Planctomycetes bacterium]|nr:hypothetical protein [Planctomycetota bacterium]